MKSPPDSPPTSAGRILVVDDEPFNRDILRDALADHGYEVVEAENGAEAIKQVAAHAPDVILLDIMMPVMDGLSACRQLKAAPATAAIPIVVITALHEREPRLEAIAAGADDYLTKPVDLPEVLLRVRNAVRSRRLYLELQASYQRLQQLEELRDNLTHMIVHDMRAPLSAMIGFLNLLRTGVGPRLSPPEKSALDTVTSSASRLADMVTTMLDVSRLESGAMPLHPESCDLRAVAAAGLDPLGPLVADRRILVLASGPVTARCDRELIRRVISNLLGNALKFAPPKTDIRIILDHRADRVRVEVIDAGPGIAPENQEKIFSKFGQVTGPKQGMGSGLGLTFCKLAVEAHGGRIGVSSEPGRGATFWFELDSAPSTPAPPPANAPPSPLAPTAPPAADRPAPAPPGRTLRILAAEDDDANRRLTKVLLESLGHHVTAVADGAQAVAAWAPGKFDALVTDCEMPAMDGFETTRQIRQREAALGIPAPQRLRILAATANPAPDMPQRCRAAGMDDFLAKPLTAQGLHHALSQAPGLPPTTPPRPPCDFDPQRPAQLCAELGAESGHMIIGDFLRDLPAALAEIRAAFVAGRGQDLARHAHSLQGISRSLGLDGFSECLLGLELAAGQSDLAAAVPPHLEALALSAEKSTAALSDWLTSNRP